MIIYNIRKARRRTPHRRIMFALSVCNMIATMGYILDPFLIPNDASDPWVFAVGNDASCVMLGAISQFGFITQPMYLGFLSIYFLMTVKFGIRQKDFEAKYEKILHGFILVIAISTALAGIFLGYIRPNVVSPGCWINPPLEQCRDKKCRESMFAILFGAIPSVLSLLAIVVSNAMLYMHVRRAVVEGQKKTMSRELKLNEFSTSIRNLAAASNVAGNEQTNQKAAELGGAADRRRMYSKKKSSSLSDISVLTEAKSTVLRSSQKQWKRVHQVGRQALLYVSAFLLTFSWPFVIHYLYEDRKGSGDSPFSLMVLQAIFLPSLGLFNAIIFILPKYQSARKKYDCEPLWWVFQQVLTGEVEKVERFSSNLSMASSKAVGGRNEVGKNEVKKDEIAPSVQRIPFAVDLNSSMLSSIISLDGPIGEEGEDTDPSETDLKATDEALPKAVLDS